jgi:ketosteroid isomerase-like protein
MGTITENALAGYEEFNRQDFDALQARLAADFSWHEAPEIPGPKSVESREEFARYVRGFDQLWDEFRFEVRDTEEAGDGTLYARVVLHGRGKASAQALELEIHHVWELRDGLFSSMRAFIDAGEARAAAGLA